MSEFERRQVTLLELDLDTCGNEYGAAPCTAGVEIDSGTSQAGGSSNSIILAAAASAVDGFHVGDRVAIPTSGGQNKDIISYNGTTKEAVVSEPFIGGAPDLVSYRILSAGAECYNTFRSCQDKANFTRQTRTYRFCTAGAQPPVGEEIRPYIDRVDQSPAEINIEKGLGRRDNVTVVLADEPAGDQGTDLYSRTRPELAGGTWCVRLLARNHNYAGRFARLKRAYFKAGWNDPDFETELYVIEKIAGPDSRGAVAITLKDPIKLTSRRKIPEPSAGKLSADITAVALSATLLSGQGASYPASGFVRIGNEIIEFTGNASDVLSWPDTGHRAKFGTTADDHSAGDGVQICETWEDVPLTTVLDNLLSKSGISAANIDTAGYAVEEADWLGPAFNVTTALSEPRNADKWIADLVVLVGGFVWWDAKGQLVKFKLFRPATPDEVVPLVEETSGWLVGTLKVVRLDELRTTTRALYYAPVSAVADLGKNSNFLRGARDLDADAESTNEYGDRRDEVRFSRWWGGGSDAAASAVVSRAAGYYRDAPLALEGKIDPKDPYRAGDLVDVEIAQIAGLDGHPKRLRVLITRREDEGGRVKIAARGTDFGRRFAFLAPDAAGDYPADPQYAHLAPDSLVFAEDDSSAYLMF